MTINDPFITYNKIFFNTVHVLGRELNSLVHVILFQQWRLFPFLASAFVVEHFSKTLVDHFAEFRIDAMSGGADADRMVSGPSSQCTYLISSLLFQQIISEIN